MGGGEAKEKVLGICIGFMSIMLFFLVFVWCVIATFFSISFFLFYAYSFFCNVNSLLFRYGNWYSSTRNRFNKNSDTVQFKLCSLSDGNRKVYKKKTWKKRSKYESLKKRKKDFYIRIVFLLLYFFTALT